MIRSIATRFSRLSSSSVMGSADDMDLRLYRVHRQQLLEESLASLEKIWPANHKWQWSSLGDRYLGDDWMMDFRGDCAEAFVHVEESNRSDFVALACDVVWMTSELIHLKGD